MKAAHQPRGYTLALMVGNTNTVVGVFADNRFDSKSRLETRLGRTADEYGLWLLEMLKRQQIKPEYVTGVVLGSVIPQAVTVLKSMASRYFKVEPVVVERGVKTGVDTSYGPGLGPDRMANIVAALHLFPTPFVVVDFGLHTSLDVVDAKGQYLGGIVTGGELLLQQTLMDRIALVPALSMERPKEVIGRDIVHSVQSGTYWGTVALVEGLLARIWQQLGQTGKVVATGGFAHDLTGDLPFDAVDTNLSLTGLKLIFNRQQAKGSGSIKR